MVHERAFPGLVGMCRQGTIDPMHTPCQLCGKRPATTHLTELEASGATRELHLCGTCIQSLGVPLQDGPPPISQLLEKGAEDVVLQTTESAVAEVVESDDEPCPHCGMKFSEYSANNLFGCAHDYTAFREVLDPLLKRYHGATQHLGRGPSRVPDPEPVLTAEAVRTPLGERRRLEAALKEAVTKEHYEEAAKVRDELRQFHAEQERVRARATSRTRDARLDAGRAPAGEAAVDEPGDSTTPGADEPPLGAGS